MASVDLGAGRNPVALTAGRWHTCVLLDNYDVKVGGHSRLACLPGYIGTQCLCAHESLLKYCRLPTTACDAGTKPEDDYRPDTETLKETGVWPEVAGHSSSLDPSASGFGLHRANRSQPYTSLIDVRRISSVCVAARSSVVLYPSNIKRAHLGACQLSHIIQSIVPVLRWNNIFAAAAAYQCFGANTADDLGAGQLGLEDTANRGMSLATTGDGLERVELGTGRVAGWVFAAFDHNCVIFSDFTMKWCVMNDWRFSLVLLLLVWLAYSHLPPSV